MAAIASTETRAIGSRLQRRYLYAPIASARSKPDSAAPQALPSSDGLASASIQSIPGKVGSDRCCRPFFCPTASCCRSGAAVRAWASADTRLRPLPSARSNARTGRLRDLRHMTRRAPTSARARLAGRALDGVALVGAHRAESGRSTAGNSTLPKFPNGNNRLYFTKAGFCWKAMPHAGQFSAGWRRPAAGLGTWAIGSADRRGRGCDGPG